MIFRNEVFQTIENGMRLKAFVKQVRDDRKIDLVLQKGGYRKVDDFSDALLAYIKNNGGFTPFNDKSDAETIYKTFGVSKKTFKQLAEIDHEVQKDDEVSFKNFGWEGQTSARYIRYRSFPEKWFGGVHFIDEIVVK